MKTRMIMLLVALVGFAASALNWNETTSNPLINGSFGIGQWSQADYAADTSPGGAADGAMYAVRRDTSYQIGSGNYSGQFFFLAHNIERLTTQENADYNRFDLSLPGQSSPLLRVWIFNDVDEANDTAWLAAAGLGGDFTSLDDRGFLVKNLYTSTYYSQWLPGGTRPEDGGYNWGAYGGVYGRGGFDNSAWLNSLPLSIANNNEVYQVSWTPTTLSPSDVPPGVPTGPFGYCTYIPVSIGDPEYDPPTPLIWYWQGLIHIPEPSSMVLLIFGAFGAWVLHKRHEKRDEPNG